MRIADGTTTYFHGCVTPIVVSPEQKQVINLEPEFIKKQDGQQKQEGASHLCK